MLIIVDGIDGSGKDTILDAWVEHLADFSLYGIVWGQTKPPKIMAKDWTKIYQEHRGKWVALGNDEITLIASGGTVKEVLEKARVLGYTNPILAQMPQELAAYVGFGL